MTPEPERDWEWPHDPPVRTGSERLAILVIAVLLIAALGAELSGQQSLCWLGYPDSDRATGAVVAKVVPVM